jgi:hypothetical protein
VTGGFVGPVGALVGAIGAVGAGAGVGAGGNSGSTLRFSPGNSGSTS